MRRFAALVLVAGCGRIAFESDTQVDASEIDAPDIDAPLDDFLSAAPIVEASAPGTDDDPTATGDALEMYFSSERHRGVRPC